MICLHVIWFFLVHKREEGRAVVRLWSEHWLGSFTIFKTLKKTDTGIKLFE